MRILAAFSLLAVLGLTPAFADAGIGCGDDTSNVQPADMSIRDLAAPDLKSPSDLSGRRDARREQRRAHGRGLVLLSGVAALAVIALRRRNKMMRPTPAESALAASETRSDS